MGSQFSRPTTAAKLLATRQGTSSPFLFSQKWACARSLLLNPESTCHAGKRSPGGRNGPLHLTEPRRRTRTANLVKTLSLRILEPRPLSDPDIMDAF
ncbi:hypothetical protein E4U42_006727 [Claviceps africana]|uniref:Uncharacterized protein n=1 Tax=Claviceps africana TaxID=83212 RepID=A0A8K0NEV5_9HYPO|nr:hypothetical protein E4U42_006727 [Claviceps africana]